MAYVELSPSTGSVVTPAALTKTDDTNVTLTLGGTPATALLQASSITAGWTGTLSVARGGTGAGTAAAALTNLGAVAKAGDTMTGNLILNTGASSTIALFKAGGGTNYTGIQAYGGATPALRWQVLPGNGVAESTGNAGTNFEISRFSDAGAYIDSPLQINRANGTTTLIGVTATGSITTTAGVMAGSAGTSGSFFFGSTGSKYLNYDGTKFGFVGGNVYHGTVGAGVDAPMSTGSTTPGAWAGGVSANDRAVLYLNTSAGGFYAYFTQGNTGNSCGSISGTTTTTAYTTSSSAELKEDLKSFDAGNIIDDTKVYDFAWKSTGERSYGVIAQQAIDVYPLAVTHVENVSDEIGEYWGVDYSKYVPVILQELKALRARVAELEGRTEIGVKPP